MTIQLEDIKVGDTLIVESPSLFPDLDAGESVMVHSDDIGSLWVYSREGHHYLDENATTDGVIRGFIIDTTPKETP